MHHVLTAIYLIDYTDFSKRKFSYASAKRMLINH
jgi:hypothetical protein